MQLTIKQISELKSSFELHKITELQVIGSLALKISDLKDEIDHVIKKSVIDPAKPTLDKLMAEFEEYKKTNNDDKLLKDKEKELNARYYIELNNILSQCQDDIIELKSSAITKQELNSLTITAQVISSIKHVIE